MREKQAVKSIFFFQIVLPTSFKTVQGLFFFKHFTIFFCNLSYNANLSANVQNVGCNILVFQYNGDTPSQMQKHLPHN